jgi:outer membrane protein assembly factor BamA/autotransporter translocation and assembly factor TamB
LCLLVVLALLALQSDPVRRFALERITTFLVSQHIDLQTDSLRYNLFTLSVDVRNLRLRSAAASDLPAFATIGHARLDLRSLTQLLRGRYVVQSGVVDDVDVHYVVDANGRDNLPRPPSDPYAPRKPLNYLITSLSISNAQLRYTNRAQQVDVALSFSPIEMAGSAMTGRHQLRFDRAHGELHVKNHIDVVDRVSGTFDLGPDDLRIDRLQFEGAGAQAVLAGTVRAFDDPQLGLTLQARVDAARAAALLDVREPVMGTIAVNATARGLLSAPAIDAHISGSNLRVRSLGSAQVEARAAYDSSSRSAHVSSARIYAPWGQLAASGELAFRRENTSRLRAELTSADVAAIMRGLNLPYVASTRVDGRVDAEWPGLDYVEASGAANATLTPTSARAAPKTMPVAGRLSARGNAGTIVAELQRLTAAGAELSGQVQLGDGRRLQGQLHASLADLALTTSTAEAFLGRAPGSLLPAPVTGAATVDARLGGTIERPAASLNVSALSLSAGAASGIEIGADLTVTPAAVTVARADAKWSGARAAMIGTVGLTNSQQLDLVLDADAADLQRVAREAGLPDVPVSGQINARGTIRGTVARPLANVTLQGADITAFGERFGSLTADAALTGRDATLSRLVLDKPQPDAPGRINLTGSYNLDRKSYTFDLGSDNIRLLGFQLADGPQIRGTLQLSGRGAGSVSSPSGTVNLAFDSLELDGLPSSSSDRTAPAAQPAQLGRIVVATTAANHQATITASAERFNLDANALIGLARSWPTTLTVHANDLELEKLPLGLRAPLDGHLRATVHATGDLTEPASGRATASIETLTGSWNGQPFSVTSPRDLRYENQRLSIERLELTARDSSLLVKGELPVTASAGVGDLAVEARANLATLARLLPADMKVTGDGAVTLTGSVRGTLKAINPDLVVTVENGTLSSPQLGPGASDIQLRARVADGAADIERLTSRWGSATIEASGTVPLEALPPLPVEIPRRGGPATFKASVRDLDPARVPGVPAGLTGRVGVDVDASAARAELTALEGHIAFPQLEIAFNRLTLTQQEPSRITIGFGKVTVDRLALSGSAGAVTASGAVGLVGERPVDVNVDGTLKLAALSALTKTIRTDGTAAWKVAARGTLAKPDLNGTLDLTDATIASDALNIAAVDVNAHVNLVGPRIELTRLSGEVNGGALDGSGSVTLGNGTISDIDLQFSAEDIAYDAPLDLRSLSDATVRVNRRGEQFLVGGQVTINEAGLTNDINFDEGLFAAIGAPRTLDLTEPRNPLLERVQFNIDVDTATPVTIDNNLARAEIDADLRVVGTPYEPGLTGRMTIAEGGQLMLNARRYEVERGVITFVDNRRIVPSIDLVLNTKASNYDVRIAVAGTPGKTETSWTSEPPLPEPDIMALVVTGRTVDEMRGEESEVARVQALTYLTGRVGSKFGRGLERATGISEVRIEPVVIANETDPTARLTVGQNVTDQVKMIYSTNLADSNDQIWVVEYDVTRRFQMRGVRERDDDSYRVDFRHDLRFGGDPAPRRQVRQRPTIASLMVTSDAGLNEASLRKLFKLKVGDTYEFFTARSGLERIEEHYLEAGFLQSRVRLDRTVDNDKANLALRVTSGPLVELRFEGMTPPSKTQREIRTAWHHGVFDKQRGNDSIRVLREWLMLDKYLQPVLEYAVEDAGERRHVIFRIQSGPKYDKVVMAFEGASGIDPGRLDKIIEQQRLERQVFTDPSAVTTLLQRYYREQGYLSAEIDAPRYDFQGNTARVVLSVHEGQRFVVRHLTVTGNTVYTSADVIAKLPVVSGGPFVSAAAEQSLERIRDLYWRKGYNDMRSEYALEVDRNTSSVDVGFTIVEGRQSVVADIAVEGNRKTSERLVRGQVELSPSQPLDLAVLARSRRNLYGTGAFSIADITREAVEGEVPGSAPAATNLETAESDNEKPVRLTVSVREVQPVQLRYGLSYDTEGGLGGILDLSVHNAVGKARVLGAQGRYDSEIHEARAYVSQPSLRSWPRKTTASVYFREDLNPPTEQTDPFDISRQGASIQQEVQFRKFYVWSYGYRYELATTLEPSLGVGVTETVRVTPLTSTLTRETRDEVLDASKGTFFSQAFAYSPSWLGSDRPYLKYYAQYFHYFPLRPEKPKPFTNEILRPRLVFATGVRVGLAHGLNGDVPTSERFYAGGSTTLRGFEQNAAGPVGVNNVPAGGNASLVLNNELRMPLVRIIDGVLFVDVGNVYPAIKDFSFTDLRESAGVGIRLRTKWILLRSDYGWVLDPRPGEKRSRFYFSIGQAF